MRSTPDSGLGEDVKEVARPASLEESLRAHLDLDEAADANEKDEGDSKDFEIVEDSLVDSNEEIKENVANDQVEDEYKDNQIEKTEENPIEEKSFELEKDIKVNQIENKAPSRSSVQIDQVQEDAEEDIAPVEVETEKLIAPCKLSDTEVIKQSDVGTDSDLKEVTLDDGASPVEKEIEKIHRKTPHPLSRVNTLKKQESGDVTMLSLKPNYDSSHHELDVDDEDEELQKLSWDSETDERIDLGLEDGTACKVQAWDTNSENGKYLTGIEAQRVIVEGMRKKVETMKNLLTPGFSNSGSVFNFSPGSVSVRKSISSTGDCDEVFQGKIYSISIVCIYKICHLL